MSNIHSTGRGGAGNVGVDNTTYVDGEIVREGFQGQSGDGEYSSGRGGAGNIHSPRLGAAKQNLGSEDVIPETAMRSDGHENFHTGRGGEGNVYKEKYGGHSSDPNKPHSSIIDKVKDMVGKGKSRENSPSRGI